MVEFRRMRLGEILPDVREPERNAVAFCPGVYAVEMANTAVGDGRRDAV